MSKLSDVSQSCGLLYSTKITEQSKGLTELKRLLDDENVAIEIRRSHNCKRTPNWNTVSDALLGLLKKECSGYAKNYCSWSETSRSNKTNKLTDLLNFLKKVIKIATSDSAKIEVASLLTFLIELWDDKIYVSNFGASILKIVDENFLGNRKIASGLPKERICQLLNICEREMKQGTEKRKYIVSSVLHSLTKVIVKNMDFVDNFQFHDIFLLCLQCLENVKSNDVIKEIISATNLYIKWSSVTHRELCCSFGESCMDLILRIWRTNTSELVLRQLVEFCALQITLHHPKLTVDTSLGFFARNLEIWCSHLYSILVSADQQLYKQMSSMQHRIKGNVGEKFDEDCVLLTGDACCVIFRLTSEGKFTMPTTMPSNKSLVKNIDFYNIGSIAAQYSVDGNRNINDVGKPWIGVLQYLLETQRILFSNQDLADILIKFHHMLMNASFKSLTSKGIEVIMNTMMLLVQRGSDMNFGSDLSISSIWKDSWNVAISCLTTDSKDAVTSALDLLGTLIEFDRCVKGTFFTNTGAFKTMSNFWSMLYLRVPPSKDSINLVTKLIQTYGMSCIDDAVFATLLQTTTSNAEFTECTGYRELCDTSVLKILLLHWVLGFKRELSLDKHTAQTLRLTQVSQINGNCTQICSISPNATNNAPYSIGLIDCISKLLACVSYKDLAGSDDVCVPSPINEDIHGTVQMFLRADFLLSFQHFNFDFLSWLEKVNIKSSTPTTVALPQCDATCGVTLEILASNLSVIIEILSEVSGTCVVTDFLKLCQSFFLYANSAGKFLYSCHRTPSFPLKYFSKWIGDFSRFSKMVMLYLECQSDIGIDAISDIVKYLNDFLEIMRRLEPLIGPGNFVAVKLQLKSSLHAIFRAAFTKLSSDLHPSKIDNSVSPTTQDEMLGLTQTLQSRSRVPVGSGYKRRRYNTEEEPRPKHTRLSTSNDCTGSPIARDSVDQSMLQWNHHFLRDTTKLALTLSSWLPVDGCMQDVMNMAVNLKSSSIQDVGRIYTMIDVLSAIGTGMSLSCVNDILDMLKMVFGSWYKDQDVSLKFLLLLSKIVQNVASLDDATLRDGALCKILEMVNIFWGLKTSHKCSHLTRMGISACMFSILQIPAWEKDIGSFDKICDLMEDTHSSVRFLAAYFVTKLHASVSSYIAIEHRSQLAKLASNLVSDAFSASIRQSGQSFPLLATALYCIFVSAQCESKDVELEMHVLLGLIESKMRKFGMSGVGVCSRCIVWISKSAYQTTCNFDLPKERFEHAYKTKYLMETLYRWLVQHDSGNLIKNIESFPCTLYGYNCMKTLCLEHVKITFPSIFSAVRCDEDVIAAYESYFTNVPCATDLDTLIRICLPDIFQLLPPNEPLNPCLSTVMDELYQKKDCYRFLLNKCIGPVVFDLFMNEKSAYRTEELLCEVAKYCSTEKRAKTTPKKDLSITLSSLVFGKQKCNLVDAFVRTRFHFESAWNFHDYEKCIKAYCRFVLLLVKDAQIPDDVAPYFVGDVVSTVSLHFAGVQGKFMNAKSIKHKEMVATSVRALIELTTAVVNHVSQRRASSLTSVGMRRISAPVVNLRLLSSEFCLKIHDQAGDMAAKLEHACQNLSAATENLNDESFQRLVVYASKSATPSTVSCIESLKDCCEIFDSLGLGNFHNPIVDKICDSLVARLRENAELTSVEMYTQLMQSAVLLLKILKRQSCPNRSVMKALVEVYSYVPAKLTLQEMSSTGQLSNNVLSDIVPVLSEAMSSKSTVITATASSCIRKLMAATDINSQLNCDFLNGVLASFKGHTEVTTVMSLQGVDRLSFALKRIADNSDVETPICPLTSALINFSHKKLYYTLQPICSIMEEMSIATLPYVIHDILLNDQSQKAKIELSTYFQTTFEAILSCSREWKHSMHLFLDVIQYLRTQDVSKRHGKTKSPLTVWDNNFWLDLNYLDLAKVALLCARPFMSILYAEIWKDNATKQLRVTKKNFTCRSLLDDLKESEKYTDECLHNRDTAGKAMDGIMIDAYCKIEDLDSLHGLAGSCSNSSLLTHIHSMENNWFEALQDYDSLMHKSSSNGMSNSLLECLKCLGLSHLAGSYQRNSNSEQQFEDTCFEATSKLAIWNSGASDESFDNRLQRCYSYLKDRHPFLDNLISDIRKDVIATVGDRIDQRQLLGSEMIGCVGKMALLEDLGKAKEVVLKQNHVDYIDADLLEYDSMMSEDSLILSSYSCAESIILNRNTIVKILENNVKFQQNQFVPENILRGNLTVQINLAIQSNREKMALHLISAATDNANVSTAEAPIHTNLQYHKLQLKRAQVLWSVGKRFQAVSMLEELQDALGKCMNDAQIDKIHVRFHSAKVLQLTGQWKDTMRMESPSVIMERYFKRSVGIAAKMKSCTDRSSLSGAEIDLLCVSGFRTLAKFADAQYRDVVEYMTSKEFEHKRNLAREAKQEIKNVAERRSDQNQKYYILLQRNSKMDIQDFTQILDKKENFLLCAVENYIKCLSLSDEDDLLMYRICALWLENTQSSSLPGLMQCACSELQSHKFVDMSYQLAARLDSKSSDDGFQKVLKKLLKKLAVDHPYHVLPVLYALAFAYRDEELPHGRGKKNDVKVEDSTSKAAQLIINEVKKVKSKLVMAMAELSNAYIEFANHDVSKYAKCTSTPIGFDKSLLINKFCDPRFQDKFSCLAVPTIEIAVDKKRDYESILRSVSLCGFKGFFELCGGINLPKIVVAMSSDGRERKHLVKGRDDLRQDAVMQHVFKVVNDLLLRAESSHSLKMCTYKVVPLSQRSGLVEWCEGTIPIGNYLIGTPSKQNYGAHHLYRPGDLLSYECRKKLSAAAGKSLEKKLAAYSDICEKFKPVFRHFFYENFVVPDRWFQRRTAYCKSVAISSMVGYILGLGDRHVQNILINKTTGEVIHIDLGVAFEQGKCLPTPEMVPFRLTRDIVDAFGSHGVEGIFRRNCERCLKVLRLSVDVITTIVEVLLHDPLHDWMMTSNKALQVQRQDVSAVESEMTASVLNASTVAELLQNETSTVTAKNAKSSLAGRALLRVKEKLRGLESGSVLSVEGQVNMLIQQATDDEKLCAMFVGWKPYI